MSQHNATIEWKREENEVFVDHKYSRAHVWRFDGGAEIEASSSPHVVPVPYSNAAFVDPEEAYVAALSSCHMLWFLSLAAKNKFIVQNYVDEAIGKMERDAEGKFVISKVTLHPQIRFAGDNLPTPEQITHLHNEAHHNCFLANSVKTEVSVED